MTACEIVPFTIEQYDSVYSLWASCDGIGISDSDSRENIARYLARNPGMSYVALLDGVVVGVVLAGHDGRRGYLHHLAVLPGCRRQGIARRLLDEAYGALREQGIDKCHGFVFRRNEEGLRFWNHEGWIIRDDVSLISRSFPARKMAQ